MNFIHEEFLNEATLFQSFSGLEQGIYLFYAVAAVLCIRPHLRQIRKYRNGLAGKGDFCHHAQYEGIFWRLAPLLYSVVINSKLLGLSVAIDIAGRLLTIKEAHLAERRFQGEDTREAEAFATETADMVKRARRAGILLSEADDGTWMAIVPVWAYQQGQWVNTGFTKVERHYGDREAMKADIDGLIHTYGRAE